MERQAARIESNLRFSRLPSRSRLTAIRHVQRQDDAYWAEALPGVDVGHMRAMF